MAKLTRQELRIIEQTKQEGAQEQAQAGPGKRTSPWVFIRSVLLFVLFFGIMALVAYLVISALT